ncbi:MAG TPA: biopolymer transporter ExbD [Gammaproteobacteria bacterium]|nr:biopolymer transporter ExbD [Gammaproteobacteria bacterium]
MQVIGRSARMARFHKRHEAAEINLTSMIDFLTILVFFLLVHGGFVRLAILELNLPTAQSTPTEEPPQFQLEVTVRQNGIEVGDRTQGLLNRFAKEGDKYPFDKLSAYLAEVKQQFPQKTDATLLLEPDIPYDVLVAVMDHVRLSERPATGPRTELFPQISIGDAPVLN